MNLYEPKSCCICFDTKNGSIVLAALSLIGSFLLIFSAVSGHLSHFVQVVLEQNHALDHQQRENITLSVCISVIVLCKLAGIFSCLLIHGIRKNRPGLMLPYLVYHRILIAIKISLVVIALLLLYVAITFGHSSVINSHPAKHVVFFIVSIMVISIKIYFNLVITAYHKKVKRALSQDHSILAEEFDIDGSGCKVKV